MPLSTYTRANLLADVRKLFPDTDQFSDDEVIRSANMAVRRIATNRLIELPELERIDETKLLTAGLRTVDIASLNARAIANVKHIDNDKVLRLITIPESNEWDETEEDEPEAYLRFADTLRIYPTPSTSYGGDTLRIVYFKRPTEYATSSSSTVELPPEFDEAILNYTLYRLYTLSDETDRAVAVYRQFEGIITSYIEIRAGEARYEDHGIGVLNVGHEGA